VSKWIEVKLKDVCEKVTVGHVGSMADQYHETGIPFLRSLNIKPYRIDFNNLKFIDEQFNQKLKKSVLKANDVAIIRTGYPGTACVIPKSLGIANCSDLVIVRPGNQLNPYFLASIFNSTFGKDLVSGNLVGAAQQHFNITVAKELKLRLPPKNLQDKIAAVLSAYDDLIENNDRRITLLEKMAGEIYREWFVRLRFPGHEQTTFHKGIPEGWELKNIQHACYVGDGAHASVKRVDKGIPYLTTKNFKSDGLNLSTVDYISSQEYKKYFGGENKTVKTPRKGDVLMGIIGSFGQPYLVDSDDEFGVSSSVAILRPNLERISSEYLYAHARSTSFLEAIHSTKSGSAQGFLSLKMIGSLPLLLPPVNLQNSFDSIFRPILNSTKIMKNQRMFLSQTRDRLLTRLISGKLSVEDLDIQFPPSMIESMETSQP
jgi:type I restriction enzyme, S subunit